MKRNYFILLVIIVIAAVLRLYKLAENPPSLYWDEASLGYNAFSILTTGHDEHGELFPIARFIAFGDYKPPGYIYATAVSMAIFGVNEFAIRFPSALTGILMVLLTFTLVRKLINNENTALIASALLAISPWSLQLSRAAFEAHLAAIFNLVGIITFIYFPRKKLLLPTSIIFFVLSFYTFNANRILAPLLIVLLSLIYFRELLITKKWVIVSVIIGVLLLLPSISYLRSRESRLRFQEVSIFTSLDIIKKSNDRIERAGNTLLGKIIHNRRIYFAKEFLVHYFDNYKGEFLFIKGDRNPRLSTQETGELYLFEAPFLIIGLIHLLFKRNKTGVLILGWLLIAPIPAATARETPHMLRIASILPTYQVITAIGIIIFWRFLTSFKLSVRFLCLFMIMIFAIGNFFYYLHHYWIHYPSIWYGEWQYGYKQMVEKVRNLENQYDRIIITESLGRPYIYFLLYNQVNPLEYMKIRRVERDWFGFWSVYGFGKYDFKGNNNFFGQKVLRVKSPGSFINGGKKLDEVYAPDGKVVFEIGEQ